MDSLTQMGLGAALGIAIGGKKYGRKAALMGAICGTIPDLDVFLPSADPVSAFTYHRGVSHSILFCLFITPLMALIFSKIKWFNARIKDRRLYLLIFLCLFTHIILDALTVYGTQIFWPLSTTPPVSIGSIFIIDPLYTLPLLFGIIAFLWTKNIKGTKWALIFSTLYLLWGLGAQFYVSHQAHKNLNLSANDKILVQTTPFNTLLWRILIIRDKGERYDVGYLSLFDKDKNTIMLRSYPTQPKLLEEIKDSFVVKRLQWFTHGFYAVEESDGAIIIRDLRMGLEPNNYIFSFIVGARQENGNIIETPNTRTPTERGTNRLSKIWKRIWDEGVRL